MLEGHAAQWIHNSRISWTFTSFPDSRSGYRGQFTDHAKPLPDPDQVLKQMTISMRIEYGLLILFDVLIRKLGFSSSNRVS